jgi:hypothetical protein
VDPSSSVSGVHCTEYLLPLLHWVDLYPVLLQTSIGLRDIVMDNDLSTGSGGLDLSAGFSIPISENNRFSNNVLELQPRFSKIFIEP